MTRRRTCSASPPTSTASSHELSAATRLPQAQLSVLAALNIADDMLKAHDEITRLRRELMETQQKLEAARK